MTHDPQTVNRLPTLDFDEQIAENRRSALALLAIETVTIASIDPKLNAIHRRLLAAIYYMMDPEEMCCWPSVATISALTGYAQHSIPRELRRLRQYGYITYSKRIIPKAKSDRPLVAYTFAKLRHAQLRDELEMLFAKKRDARVPEKSGMPTSQNGENGMPASRKKRDARVPTSGMPASRQESYKEDKYYTNPEGSRAGARKPPVDWKSELNADNKIAEQSCWWNASLQIEISDAFRAELVKTFPLLDIDAGLRIVAGENIDKQGRTLTSGLGMVAAINRRFGYLQNDAHTRKSNYDRTRKPEPNTSGLSKMQILERKARGLL